MSELNKSIAAVQTCIQEANVWQDTRDLALRAIPELQARIDRLNKIDEERSAEHDELKVWKGNVIDRLDYEPDAQHAIGDMANVGYALMKAIKLHKPAYCWNESPAEIVGDLCEELREAKNEGEQS